jgi:hypothetical protein
MPPSENFSPASTVHQLVAALFDKEFYLNVNPDVRSAGVDPIKHYVETGWKEGRDPSPHFQTAAYLDANPDVRQAGICPLVDYVTTGVLKERPLQPVIADPVQEQVALAFAAEFYLGCYPDVAAAAVDPLKHYQETGWREGRNPSPHFDTLYYLETNPDVRESGVCPLVHYVVHGKVEGRLPRRPPDPRRQAIDTAVSREERIRPWLSADPIDVISDAALKIALRDVVASQTSGIVVGLSHDDYAANVGGVQNCVRDDAEMLKDLKWSYLHLSPAQPLPVLAAPATAEGFLVSLRHNGERIGNVRLADLMREWCGLELTGVRRLMIVHHLMGFCPELVATLAEVVAPERTIVWIHDLFTLCPSWAMLRNNVIFCGGPPADSKACGICAYGGDERRDHLERMRLLFAKLKPTVLAPSETALNFWRSKGLLAHDAAHVVAHGTLRMNPLPASTTAINKTPLRIGFAGRAAYLKGWHVFEELAFRHLRDPRYAFYHFGIDREGSARNITFVRVAVDSEQPQRMVDSLIANQIDVIVNWSLCYETFSFSTHEALAAGTFVIAPKDAGNIVPAITQAGIEQGIGLGSEEDLFRLFETGEVLKLLGRQRPGEFHFQSGTVRFLEGLR